MIPRTLPFFVSALLFAAGLVLVALAVRHERLMQRHRQPGVSYRAVTLRMDGGWRRADLFTPEGLAHQRRASAFGLAGVACWVASLLSLVVFRS